VPERQLGIVTMSNINNILLEHQYDQTIKGVAALLLGFDPPRRSTVRYRETYWLITLAAAAWFLWRLHQIRAAWRTRHDARTAPRPLSLLKPAGSLVDPGLSIGLVFGLRFVLQ